MKQQNNVAKNLFFPHHLISVTDPVYIFPIHASLSLKTAIIFQNIHLAEIYKKLFLFNPFHPLLGSLSSNDSVSHIMLPHVSKNLFVSFEDFPAGKNFANPSFKSGDNAFGTYKPLAKSTLIVSHTTSHIDYS